MRRWGIVPDGVGIIAPAFEDGTACVRKLNKQRGVGRDMGVEACRQHDASEANGTQKSTLRMGREWNFPAIDGHDEWRGFLITLG